ncbi:protein SCO1/2 [Spirosoma lacussanchae]|uniref:SCO family protein n=1 Tax=Spirosoma lacussanchae TaxID=1884249 RepID=UPI001107ABF7|nr:SCO family protein [Spirosoma lacussanchae]
MSGIQLPLRISGLLGLYACLLACQPKAGNDRSAAVPYYNTPTFTPVWLTDPAEVDKTITHRIANFSFRDQTGQVVTQAAVADRIHVANFFFTSCPSICPRMTNLLKTVQDTFRHEPRVKLLSFSVTPWLDSVPRLRRYADQKGVLDSKWHLLTGSRGAIYDLARQSYFAEEAIGFTRDSTEFLHTEHIILVDQQRRIRGVYNGTQPLDIDKLIADIRALLP